VIPNIVKGTGITGALAYAMGQGNDAQTGERLEPVPGEKSRAEILGGQNFGFEIDSPERLELARRIMEWQGLPENQAGKTRKLERDCFHASLSWGDGQQPTREEMLEAGQSFLKAVGLEKARAVFIRHDDTDHAHIHIVASRIDPETGRSLTLENDFIHGQKWAAQWERDHGQQRSPEQGRKLHSLMDAVERRDAAAVLAHLTRDKATFQPWEVNRALAYGNLDADAREKFRAEILGQPNVIGLRETADADVSRYTTREVLAAEMALQRNAATLAGDARHGIKASRIDEASTDFSLKPEQAAALRHLTGAEGFAMLWGEAGTGKSHTLKAARAAYEAEGKSVIGLSWTNDVVQQMRGDGFKQANTIASELWGLDHGRTRWNRNTVLIVDEAAMISTEQLARLTAGAKQAGAKLILAGDDKQLSSIEAGGMFETLRQTHGAAILKDVQRVRDAEQKAAFGQMHDGGFLEPLKTFEKAGGIHWTTRQSDTLKEMAARYTADVAVAPDKSRFMFAYTNKDVAALNEHARALHRARGDLGEDHTLPTAAGAQAFASGDRIQFTGNGRTKAEKNAGLTNGRVGTVSALEIDRDNRARVTAELDTAKGAEPQQVSFIVGEDARAGEFNSFRHGYAGTIYRGQGRTLDEVYVAHSPHMRSSAAYVALTRHRESVHIYAARETVKDLDAMAESMARPDNKRAATAYRIDERSAARAELENAITGFSGRQPAIAETPARTAAGARAMTDRPQASTAETAAPAGQIAQGVAAGAAAILDGVAGFAEKAIDALASIFDGGGAAAPQQEPPKQPPKEPPARPAKQTHAERVQAFLEAERQQPQETARRLGVGDAMSEDELRREQEAQEKRSRDRGGGQSR
jgi:ATP-dependent exoDNAse (exonuclease V) alpha subunit